MKNFFNKHLRLKKLLTVLLSLLFWLFLWILCAYKAGNSLILPSPGETFSRLSELAGTVEFYRICLYSLARILLGTVYGIVCGTVLAVCSAAIPAVNTLLTPAVTVVRATPVASFIILAMLWLGMGALPAFIAALMVFPVLYQNIKEGIRQVSADQLKLRTVFDLSLWKTVTKIYIPAVLPYFVSATVTAIGLSWKAGIAAEVLAFSPDSIGRKLSQSKNYLETVDLFAWTAAVVLLSLCIELLFKKLIALLLPHAVQKEAKQ